MSKSGVFSGPYFLLSGLNTEKYGPNPVSTRKVVTLSYFVHYDTFITKCGRYYLQNLTGVIKCVGTLNNQRSQSIKRARKILWKHPSWQCFMKTILYIWINIEFTVLPPIKNLNRFYNHCFFAYNSFEICQLVQNFSIIPC